MNFFTVSKILCWPIHHKYCKEISIYIKNRVKTSSHVNNTHRKKFRRELKNKRLCIHKISAKSLLIKTRKCPTVWKRFPQFFLDDIHQPIHALNHIISKSFSKRKNKTFSLHSQYFKHKTSWRHNLNANRFILQIKSENDAVSEAVSDDKKKLFCTQKNLSNEVHSTFALFFVVVAVTA